MNTTIRTTDLQQMAGHLKEIETKSRDFIAQKPKLEMVLEEFNPDGTPKLSVPKLKISENLDMILNPWAHSQLAGKLEIPEKYYDRMLHSEPRLLVTNVNTWLNKPSNGTNGKFLIRATDNEVRAVLSDRYKPIANEAVFFTVLDSLNDIHGNQFTVRESALSDTTMYMKITSDTVHLMQPEFKHPSKPELNGDPMFPGIVVRNSEVGASKFQADVYMWRQYCSNGAILTSGVSKVHIGKKIGGEGEINFSERTEELDSKTVLSAIKDIVVNVFEPEKMQVLIDKIRKGQDNIVDEPVKAVENVCKGWKLPDTYKDEILSRFGPKTQYGLGNAITEFGRDQEDIDRQVKLEEIGGEILTLGPDEFRKAVVRKEQ